MKQAFIPSIHAFRGFAIINIIAIHAISFIFYYAGHVSNAPHPWLPLIDRANEILLHDSTLYFTLISGILFSLILAERGWKKFFTSKFNFVVLPYLLFTLLFSWSYWSLNGINTQFSGTFTQLIQFAANNFLTGNATYTLWYMPVLFCLYLLTPFISILIKHQLGKWPTMLIMLAPLFLSRTWPDQNWTNVAYFLGAYTLGMVIGSHYQKAIELIQRYRLMLVALACITSLLLWFLISHNVSNWGITSFKESVWYVQKIMLAGLVLLWLERQLKQVPAWLDTLSNFAFPLYFIHAYLIFVIYSTLVKANIQMSSLPIIFFYSIGTLISVILTSVLIIHAIKKVSGKWSRYLIGA